METANERGRRCSTRCQALRRLVNVESAEL